jgi:hypothetical protein
MTSPTAYRLRRTHPVRRAAASHLFAVGQPVRFRHGVGILASEAIFRVTATLPALGNSLQYRLRADDEGRERVATEDSLDPVTPSASQSETLIQRTFGSG